MSWLARSIANGLRLDDDEEDAVEGENPDDEVPRPTHNHALPPGDRRRDGTLSTLDGRLSATEGDATHNHGSFEDPRGDYNQGRGVKEDLSEFRDSITRQFWGVASFLAPPPPPPPPPPPSCSQRSRFFQTESKYDRSGSDNDDEDNEELADYKARESGQFAELVSFSPSEDYYTHIVEEASGITEEVLAFAMNIAHHPETWLDFPIEEEEFDDIDISDAQYKHVLAVEHLATRLAALRIELCPVHMSEGYFWMVYFVLLHSRLNKHDADLLSSPQIVQARGMWMQELQKRSKAESHWLGMGTFHSKESVDSPRESFMMRSCEDAHFRNVSDQITPFESSMHQITAEHEIEKHSVNETEFIDKSVIREDPSPKLQEKEMVASSSFKIPAQDINDDDDDDWLMEDSDLIGYSGPSIVVNEEDISFSDLEDDLDCTMPIKSKKASTEENRTTKTS